MTRSGTQYLTSVFIIIKLMTTLWYFIKLGKSIRNFLDYVFHVVF